MTAEQALFRCVFVEYGDDPIASRVNVPDEMQKGNVLLCTFPGFWKIVKEDKQDVWVPIKKATAELESAFIMSH